MTRVVALMTCHNRRDKTLACLRALRSSEVAADCTIEVVLVDDGSTDGTATAVAKDHPDVHVLIGTGALFWNGGMRLAYNHAKGLYYDYLLWLNDDTLVDPTAVSRMLVTADACLVQMGRAAIVCGATRDSETDKCTYGGLRKVSGWRRTSFVRLEPLPIAQQCETMNGNLVLIPREIARAVGNLSPEFVHGLGDLDYGLRAREQGYSVWLMAGFGGTCTNDKQLSGSFLDKSLSVFSRLRLIASPKSLPLKAWLVFTRRHCGVIWFAYFLWPYARVMAEGIVNIWRQSPRRETAAERSGKA